MVAQMVKNLPVKQGTLSGAALGIADKVEARPQPPLPQAWSRDEGVRYCDSDLVLSFLRLSWLERMLTCLLLLRKA